MEHFDFDFKKCRESKRTLNKQDITRVIYKDCCSSSNVLGSCTEMYDRLKPDSIIDFYEKWLSYAETNHYLQIANRGLTYDEFYELAIKYKTLVEEQSDIKYDLSVYFYGLINHAIVETYIGQKKEREVMKFLSYRGYNPSKVNGIKDAMDGVDIAVRGISEDFYLQVKPISFFLAKKQDTVDDNIKACHNRERVLELEGIDTYYIIYNFDDRTTKMSWVGKENGNILFHINELFEYDKNDIDNTFKRLPIPRQQYFDLFV